MATILEFKLPNKAYQSKSVSDTVISSSVNDVMLIIHHALHGTDEDYQPKDRELAAQLLDELSLHIKNNIAQSEDYNEDDYLVLSHGVSQAVVVRYPG